METLQALRVALDRAKVEMDERFAKVYAARALPVSERVALDLDYKRSIRAFNAAEDAYDNALRDAIATEAA